MVTPSAGCPKQLCRVDMRVKVSYTVNIDEVPEEVRFVLGKAEAKMGNIRRAITKLTDVESSALEQKTQQAISEIEALRKDLFDADLLLSDSEGILRGYLLEKVAPQREQETQNDEPES